MYAVTVTADGKPDFIDFPQPKHHSEQYRIMSHAVGGFIECVTVRIGPDIFDMWVNEEGLLLRLPYNGFASSVYQSTFQTEDALIVGDVLFTGYDGDGHTLPLSMPEVDAVMYAVSKWAEARTLDVI